MTRSNQIIRSDFEVWNERGLTGGRLVFLGAVAAAALVLRLYHLGAESLWLDEFAQVYLYPLPLSYIVTKSAHLAQPPLDVVIGACLHQLGLADSDWWVRVPACVFGAGSVFLLGWLVTRVAGFGAGVTAALMLAVCPLHVAMSQEARPYSLLVFLALASALMFAWAWRRPSLLRWSVFAGVYLCLLMTRWTDPHVLTLGLCMYMAGVWLHAWRDGDAELRRSSVRRIWAAATAGLAAYAAYGPVFGIIFDHSRRAISSDSAAWLGKSAALVVDAFSATLHGYSWRTLYTALPGSPTVSVLGAALAIVGAMCLVHRWRSARTPDVGLFLCAFLPFPFLYAVVFGLLANAPGKPQYLILLIVPLLGCIAIAADALPRLLSRRRPALAVTGWCILVFPLAGWMLRASVGGLTSQDKRDWRAVMGYLEAHAEPDDTFAAVSPDRVPTRFHTPVGGLGRYFTPPSKFLRIQLGRDPSELEAAHWSRTHQTVWVVCITDPMYRGRALLPVPRRAPAPIRVHAYHGLFLLEIPGRDPAWSRLATGIEYLYRDLPEGRSLVAPGVLVGRLLASRGYPAAAARLFQHARRQCADEEEVAVLTRKYLPTPDHLAQTHRASAQPGTSSH